jgi:hypothetical protein
VADGRVRVRRAEILRLLGRELQQPDDL